MRSIFRTRGAAPLSPARRVLPHSTAAAVLLAGALAAAQPVAPREGPLGIREVPRYEPAEVIPGEYIVTFGNGIGGPILYGRSLDARLAAEAVRYSEAAERQLETRRDGSVIMYRYRAAIVGFAARLSGEALREINRIPGVRIEPNRTVPPPRDGAASQPEVLPHLFAKMPAPPPLPLTAPPSSSAPRGLDRIDRRLRPMDGVFRARFRGTNVHVYVIDTGIFAAHSQFATPSGSRVLSEEGPGQGHNATKDGLGTRDCGDHGTGVASVIGGKSLGVAPDVIIHPVRVFPCSRTPSSVAVMFAGVDWVAEDRKTRLTNVPVVVNISFMTLTGPKDALSTSLNNAVANSIKAGIPYVIAAGNALPNKFAVDACTVSPALVADALTVGNIKPENDVRMMDSNFGPCLDLFAPGVQIPVALSGGINFTGDRDGTSYAAPHVTGVVALYLQKNPLAQPFEIRAAILKAANVIPGTAGWFGIGNRGPGSPNVLLHWGCGSDDGVVDAPLPTKAQPSPPC